MLSILAAGFAVQAQDAEGTTDPPYLSRMPNFVISESNNRSFDAYKVCSEGKILTVEGKIHQNQYVITEGAEPASSLQIRRNYANAIKGIGGTVVTDKPCDDFDDPRAGAEQVTGKLVKNGREVWIEVVPQNEGADYQLTVVEVQAMEQEVSASELLAKLNNEGRAALYMNFDTNSATIKPESGAVVDQVAQMLTQSAALKLSIEGHTDNAGVPEKNKTLSEQRAKSVLNALVTQGISSARLSAQVRPGEAGGQRHRSGSRQESARGVGEEVARPPRPADHAGGQDFAGSGGVLLVPVGAATSGGTSTCRSYGLPVKGIVRLMTRTPNIVVVEVPVSFVEG